MLRKWRMMNCIHVPFIWRLKSKNEVICLCQFSNILQLIYMKPFFFTTVTIFIAKPVNHGIQNVTTLQSSNIWENPLTKFNTLCCSFWVTYIYMLVYFTRNFSLQHPSTSLPGSEERNFPHMPQSILSSWTPTSSLHAVDHPAAHPC